MSRRLRPALRAATPWRTLAGSADRRAAGAGDGMRGIGQVAALAVAAAAAGPALAGEPVLVQCGREYQAAKAAGTLNGADWNHYRVDCATRLKAEPAAVAAQPTVAAQPVAANPAAPAVAAQPSPPPPAAPAATGGGRAAMNGRQKQCGAEWRAQKAALVAQTPGLRWPQYWSQCNARLKAAGG